MKFEYLPEPELLFGKDKHICPKFGIREFDVYDTRNETRKTEILVGLVGIEEDVDSAITWLDRCKAFIPAKPKAKQPNLFQPFLGFHKEKGFCASLLYSSETTRFVSPTEIDIIFNAGNNDQQVLSAVDCFHSHCKFLSDVKNVDIIICVVPSSFEDKIVKSQISDDVEESAEEKDEPELETNFRRALKAKCMAFDSPIQLIRHKSLTDSKSNQDAATRAWNFCTAIYYKSLKTIPWKLEVDESKPKACYTGISFYRSRDRKTTQTSLAQIFNENGKGVILRGTPVMEDKNDGIPHLTFEQSYELLKEALTRYKFVLGYLPARLVLHKTSKFYPDELRGFETALQDVGITEVDIVTILETEIRFFRNALYPPVRGSLYSLSDTDHILYTRGSVHYYQTYAGLYVPAPLNVRIVKRVSSIKTVCNEILGLTKMNWNNSQFDNKYPITIGCARRVGEIMKYLSEKDVPRESYAFYM
ncbi:MAG: hypothetical protein WAU36_18900 [Cyclobacteriaceae bacterium]